MSRRPSTYPSADPLPRERTSHHTSSAFSVNAQPNEDWTKITDLAERRRIQNRIAQRNYRKKLKRKQEDADRRESSVGPAFDDDVQSTASADPDVQRRARSTSHPSPQSHRAVSVSPSPDTRVSFSRRHTEGNAWGMLSAHGAPQPSSSPQPYLYPVPTAVQPLRQSPQPSYSSYVSYAPASTAAFEPAVPAYLQQYQPAPLPDWEALTKPMCSQPNLAETSVSPMNLGYAQLPVMDMSWQPQLPEDLSTPELYDLYESASSDSPDEFSLFPATPPLMAAPPPGCFLDF